MIRRNALLAALFICSAIPCGPVSAVARAAEVGVSLSQIDDRDVRDLSPDELREVERRMSAANRGFQLVEPFLSDSEFGGIYVEPATGVVTILTTGERLRNALTALASGPLTGEVKFRMVIISLEDLRARTARLVESWQVWSPAGVRPQTVSADVSKGVITVGYLSDDYAALGDADGLATKLAERVGVSVEVTTAEPAVEEVCTSRTNCYSPMKAGIRINSVTGAVATMGFHVNAGADRMFVTAGHVANGTMTHAGYGSIGTTISSLYAPGTGMDMDLVQMPDSQVSRSIYGSASLVSGARDPILGEIVTVSLGNSNAVRTGTVTEAWGYQYRTGCGCYVAVATASYTSAGGDSGSPVYVGGTAVGIHSAAGGRMTPLASAIAMFGVSVYTG